MDRQFPGAERRDDGGDRQAREIVGKFKPAMTKGEYLAFARGWCKKGRQSGALGS